MHADTIASAFEAATQLGDSAHGRTSPNPPVGAVILDRYGHVVGTGATEPAGGRHAEAVALAQAGERAQGGIAVVTLEPCNHTGRTGPCSHALLAAGIAEVHFAQKDPNPTAQGGADFLRSQGVRVAHHSQRVKALEPWLTALAENRPAITLKMAQTLDGFTAAVDGTSQWITGEEARADVHRDRVKRDAIIIGTGTALADNPSLTARPPERTLAPDEQPRRVVIGSRNIDAQAHNLVRLGYEQYPNIDEALSALWETGARDVLVEGGARLAGAFMERGLVDALRIYIAPMVLGDGLPVLAGRPASTLTEARRFRRRQVTELGPDILLELSR